MVKKLLDKFKRAKNPIQYWRSRGAVIGKNCTVYGSVSFGSEPYLVSVGDHVRVSANTSFVTHDGGLWVVREMYEELKEADKFGRIKVGDNVHIGINCVIGVGAVVTKDIPDNSIAVGVPARVIGTVEEYKNKNLDKLDFTKSMTPAQKKAYLLEKYK